MAVCQNQPVILDYETGAAADFDSAAFVQHFRRYFFTNRRLQTERNAEKGKETPNFLFQLVLGFTDDDANHGRNYFFDYFDDWRFFHMIFLRCFLKIHARLYSLYHDFLVCKNFKMSIHYLYVEFDSIYTAKSAECCFLFECR